MTKVGPWIEHDGGGYPVEVVRAERGKGAVSMRTAVTNDGVSHTPSEITCGFNDPNHPGWTWKRKMFGGWRASNRVYARILKYRFIYETPPAAEKSEQVEMLKAIAKGDREPSEVGA